MADVQIAVIDQQNVQIAVIDPENTQLALAAPAEAAVNVAVPGIQGPVGTTGSVTIAQAGTAATPGIRFESDTNTGIYSPGADQLAVSTGGTGRLFVDASGNVGIGTTSPAGQLQVALASSYAPGASWDDKTVVFGGTGSFSGAVGIAYDDTNGGYISSIVPGSAWKPLTLRGSYLSFAIDAAGERLRIDSSGNVGIGTSSPGYALDVAASDTTASTGYAVRIRANATAGAGALQFTDSGATAQYGLLVFGANGVGTLQADGASSRLAFGTNATERLRIDSAGNVGIGTSSPSQKLHVSGGDTTNVGFNGTTKGVRFDFDGTQASIFGVDNTFFASYQPLRIGGSITQFMYGGTEAARIDSSGRVGIGTTSPSTKLDVADTGTTSCIIRARNDTTSVYLDANNAFSYLNTFSNHPMLFGTNNTERARIDSSGRLLVGTSSAYTVEGFNRHSYFCPTAGDTSNQIVVSAVGAAGFPAIYFTKTRGASPATQTIVQNNDSLGRIRFFGSDGVDYDNSAASIDCAVDGTPGANDMPGRLVFSTAADGAASPTERMRITSGGNVGIGVSSPSSPLEVAGQINAVAPFAGFAAFQTAAGTGFRWALNNDGTFFLQRTTDGFATGSISINVDSSNRVGIGTTSPTTLLDVNTDTVRVRIARTPASAAATGATGEICWDANYIYVCTATNTWKRSALSTW
jgi:hypothetical protein